MTLENLTSPTWWVTAVAGAIALKVASDYVRQGLEKLFSKGFNAWSQRSKAAKEEFERLAQKLAHDSDARELYYRREVRFGLLSIVCFLGSIFSLVGWTSVILLQRVTGQPALTSTTAIESWAYIAVNLVCALSVCACMAAALSAYSKATNIMKQLQAAERIRRRLAEALKQPA